MFVIDAVKEIKSADARERVKQMLVKNDDVFSKGKHDLGRVTIETHGIVLKEGRSLKEPARRCGMRGQEETARAVNEML